MPQSDAPQTSRSKPLKWAGIAVLVLAAIGGVAILYFLKSSRPPAPRETADNRAVSARLQAAGWQRIPTTSRRIADRPGDIGTAVGVSRGPAGLPSEIAAAYAPSPPGLPQGITGVLAATTVPRGTDYSAFFQCTYTDLKRQLDDIVLYRKGNVLVLLPTTETVAGKLLTRTTDGLYGFSFPTQSLAPGRYTVLLVAKGPAAKWEFAVR